MRTQPRVTATALALGACLAGWAATAGVVIEQEQREPGSDTPVGRTTLYLEAGSLRVESSSPEGEDTLVIFNEATQVVWVIDPSARTYYEMTAAKVSEMRERMDRAKKEMEAQLAQMPPERRQVIEEMMKQQLGGAAELTVREMSRGEKVGPFVCVRYELLFQGERGGEVWAAPFEQLQLREAEYKTFQALGRFFEPLGQTAPGGAGQVPGGPQVEGFPVRSLTYDGQRVVAEEKVLKAERRALEASLFTLPPGLEKSEFGPEE